MRRDDEVRDGGIEERVAALLPCLMLARVDGKSPVEYLSQASRAIVRERAIPLITQAERRVSRVLEAVQN